MRALLNTLGATVLPPTAVVEYVAPSWNPGEEWPMFQLAYTTAHVLGVEEAARAAMFDAVSSDEGPLAVLGTPGNLPATAPTIADVARFYEGRGLVPAAKFLATSRSYQVHAEIQICEEMVAAYGIDHVPCIVVNGKYRLDAASAGGLDQMIQLVNYLVRKEAEAS
jgi:thiol:disulfide interchange protein DsbA